MTRRYSKVVNELVYKGWTVVPPDVHGINPECIGRVLRASQILIKHLLSLPDDIEVGFARAGEGTDKDIGLISRSRDRGLDVKHFFHFSHEFPTLVQQRPKLELALQDQLGNIDLIATLYHELIQFVGEVIYEVEGLLRFSIDRNTRELRNLFRQSAYHSHPFGTSVLRSLWYEPMTKPTGARPHFDRDFITAHMGDEGGSLYGHRELGVGEKFLVSPKMGEIVLFWGLRAATLSNGHLVPLYHSATALPHEERQALVFFGTTPWPPIQRWEEGWQYFCHHNGIAEDPAAWYQEQWQK